MLYKQEFQLDTATIITLPYDFIDTALSSLQAHPYPYPYHYETIAYRDTNDVKQSLCKQLPCIFGGIDNLTGGDYRFEATKRVARLISANPDLPAPRWRPILLSNPDFKYIKGYPVIAPCHKYHNAYIYREWMGAKLEHGFTSKFAFLFDRDSDQPPFRLLD